MIYIQKGKEPVSLIQKKNTPSMSFDDLDKTEIRNQLLVEQKYLCAYCMRRIRDNNSLKIEHYHDRNKENEMDYKNLLAVCDGNQKWKSETGRIDPRRFTCDTKKGNNTLTLNPQKKSDMETIYYDNSGKIYSKNSVYNKELNEILNLNDKYGTLISNRKAALKPVIHKLNEIPKGKSAETLLRKLEKVYNNTDSLGQYQEYVGIIQWYIKKHLKRY